MSKLPVALAAVRLLPFASGGNSVIYVASSEHRAEGIAEVLGELAPDALCVCLPAWDCLPYEPVSPSPDVLGRQSAALRALDACGETDGARRSMILVTVVEATVQRLPPAGACARTLEFALGDPIEPEKVTAALRDLGYGLHAHVHDHGEVAARGEVMDLFPPGPRPFRLTIGEGRIASIHPFDPATQLSTGSVESLSVGPVSMVVGMGDERASIARDPGFEHRFPELHPALRTVFDVLPEACIMLEPLAEARLDEALLLAERHYAEACEAQVGGKGHRPAPARPDRLYLGADEWRTTAEPRRVPLPGSEPTRRVPHFYAGSRPRRHLAEFVAQQSAAGHRVVLLGACERDRATLSRAAGELGPHAIAASGWEVVTAAAPGSVLVLASSAEHGFIDDETAITTVCGADLLGHEAQRVDHHHHHTAPVPWHCGEGDFSVGDTVIHIDHGVGSLQTLETLHSDGAGLHEMVRLDYAKGADLLAPVESLDRLWRYGAGNDAIRLDRLDDDTWTKRRQRIAVEIAETARGLIALARAREGVTAPVMAAPHAAYRAFTARFPYPLTLDQAGAIEAVTTDLASGRPMDRLVVGDVGFGKTEVALRAAAIAALAGHQVAVVAPTTVLARQHARTFAKRFADHGLAVAQLSRLTAPAEARAIKAGLADGTVRIVVGTHALAAADVAFADLGLLIIDEEQRFGNAAKGRLRALGTGVHVLTLTATPIPRTLETALVGLQDLSVIATPPARRRPIRTLVGTFDAAAMMSAVTREKARGGQSFVVVPRVESLSDVTAMVRGAAPDLVILEAHGSMEAEAIEDAMLAFAEGRGDVLVATSLIESGLDVPRANTMVVWGADLFGMAQLHQLRGRVGRGRLQGLCYLMTDPGAQLSDKAKRRLESLASFDRLGSGLALAARDLDMRGAGDLVGDDQAGHLRLIGLGLYQHLLSLAIREARGEVVEDWSPEIHVDRAGSLPADYIPDPEIRLNLYVRMARVSDVHEAEALAEELADRFGPLPPDVDDLLTLVRLKALCRALGIARVEAGPKAIALDLRPSVAASDLRARAPGSVQRQLQVKGRRLIYGRPSDTSRERLSLAARLLSEFG